MKRSLPGLHFCDTVAYIIPTKEKQKNNALSCYGTVCVAGLMLCILYALSWMSQWGAERG